MLSEIVKFAYMLLNSFNLRSARNNVKKTPWLKLQIKFVSNKMVYLLLNS